jgi:glycosyltransferase involved in cell wall biosynthesis
VSRTDKEYLIKVAEKANYAESCIFMRDLSSDELMAQYRAASLLIAPLSNDDGSLARFPSKLADYLLSGRPVVTSRYGEAGYLLRHLKTAYLAESHSVEGYSQAITTALADPSSVSVGERGRDLALEQLSYEHHGKVISDFLRKQWFSLDCFT